MTSREIPGTPAPAVLRAAGVLDAIAGAEDELFRVSDLARHLGIPKSSMSNILAALTQVGLVRRIGRGYALGPTLVDLASVFLRQKDPVQRFRYFVATLPTVLNETTHLATLQGSDVVYLARHDGNQLIALTSIVGKRLPASSTALGKAMLSQLSRDEIDQLVDEPLSQLTERSHLTLADLAVDLDATRERGYAIDDEEAAANVVCLAVAVPGRTGQGLHAVSATLFKDRLDSELRALLIEDLTQLASYLSTT